MKIEHKIKYFKALGPKMYYYRDINEKPSFHGKGFPIKLLSIPFFENVSAEPFVVAGII